MSKHKKTLLNSLHVLLSLPILMLCVCVQMPDHCGDGTAPLGASESCPPDGVTYTLIVTAGSGGTVSPSGTSSRNAGIQVSIKATPNANCSFTGWSGDLSGTANPASVIMNGDRTVTANFNCGGGGKDHGYFNPNINYGSFTDSRDGQSYRTVTIGTQTWMAENLNFEASGSMCSPYCFVYGRLYDWATVMNLPLSCNSSSCAHQVQFPHRGICPSGWHVPSDVEWTTLVNYVGASTAGTKLRTAAGWNIDISGTDDYGFSALPGGCAINNLDGLGGWLGDWSFGFIGYSGFWWSAREKGSYAWSWEIYSNEVYSDMIWNESAKTVLFSLRCAKD
jgi:uncharacterized protein (TIGR02145 family)